MNIYIIYKLALYLLTLEGTHHHLTENRRGERKKNGSVQTELRQKTPDNYSGYFKL